MVGADLGVARRNAHLNKTGPYWELRSHQRSTLVYANVLPADASFSSSIGTGEAASVRLRATTFLPASTPADYESREADSFAIKGARKLFVNAHILFVGLRERHKRVLGVN